MTPAELAKELRALHEKATPGPWEVPDDEGRIMGGNGEYLWWLEDYGNGLRDGRNVADASLIAFLRNHTPAIIAALEQLQPEDWKEEK